VITWDLRSLYDAPSTGVCEISGKYETGRFYDRDGKRIFVGNTAAPKSVDDYVRFATMLDTVKQFKRGYPKSEWTAKRV